MAFLDTIRERAVSTLNQVLDRKPTNGLSKDEIFCRDYNLPDSEIIVHESSAEVSISSENSKEAYRNELLPQGKIYLTDHFLVFSDSYDRNNCSFTLHLSSVKKVERSQNSDYAFALTITTYSKISITIYLVGIRSESERFAQTLKITLKRNLVNNKKLQPFIQTCYSEYLLAKNKVSNEKIEHMPAGGLGLVFKFPGNPKEQRDKSKMKLWFDLFRIDGRNLSLIKTPMFYKLIRVGLPNRLRGEIWELCCGSIYLRFQNQNEYHKILEDNKNRTSFSIDEIEKDLNRSLPEYAAYQTPEGISRLRNVLTAYSWKNPEVGYCQAMNIVVAALLIYMSEEQAFWSLNLLVDKIVPGYYSKTMYGTLLDQKVFESLVQTTMPLLWDHITKNDIQLSVVSLPWFLSLYLSSMPLVFAFRILDVFFLQGPKTLFQVALAVLKINGEQLLQTEDDGSFISIIKDYFQELDQSAHPTSPNPKYKSITKFQELLVTAFKEFSNITSETIETHRRKHRDGIFQNISTFVKRTELRNLPKTNNIDNETLSIIYDRFYSIVQSDVTVGTGSNFMDFRAFRLFMAETCDWVQPNIKNDKSQDVFLNHLFAQWDIEGQRSLSLSNLIIGLNKIIDPDLMTSMSNFFQLYDYKNTGRLDREGILQVSEDLLNITSAWKDGVLLDSLTETAIENAVADEVYKAQASKEDGKDEVIQLPSEVNIDKEKFAALQSERYLQAASGFIQRAFEYAQPEEEEILIKDLAIDDSIAHNAALNPNTPVFVNLPTFRMVVLADETYELFFSQTFRTSFHLDKPLNSKFDTMRNLRGMFDGLLADGLKVAHKVRQRMDSAASSALNPIINSDNSSLKSTNRLRVQDDYEEERDDDLGVISIDEDLLQSSESQAVEKVKKKTEAQTETEKKSGVKYDQSGDSNLIDFDLS
ncbi:GTPase activating protein [Scheffersomyces coipomensis]|uniref:GTPase activating protein n=1 Tax=Scheffersomyces coipomensis TaxID=1788519 RepID=UPI00315D4931